MRVCVCERVRRVYESEANAVRVHRWNGHRRHTKKKSHDITYGCVYVYTYNEILDTDDNDNRA